MHLHDENGRRILDMRPLSELGDDGEWLPRELKEGYRYCSDPHDSEAELSAKAERLAEQNAELRAAHSHRSGLEFATRPDVGWSILPLHPNTDKPQCDVSRKTRDRETAEKLWREFPGADVGLYCGSESGVVAISVEHKNGGVQAFAAMTERYGFPQLNAMAYLLEPTAFYAKPDYSRQMESQAIWSDRFEYFYFLAKEPNLYGRQLAPGVRFHGQGDIIPLPYTDNVWWDSDEPPSRIYHLPEEFIAEFVNQDADIDMTTALSDVRLESVDFLWDPFIPKGKLVVLAGEPKDGKSTIAVTVCAALSAGLALPGDLPGVHRMPQTVLYFTAEDGVADTILPRAINAGANLSNFRTATLAYSSWEKNKRVDRQITLANTEKLRAMIEKHKPSLIVIDPIQAFIGASVDLHKANSVRPILAGVAKLAEDYGVTVLIIAHLNKSDSKGAHRILGSIDFVAAARCVLMTARDPLTRARYLCIERATYGGDDGALLYTIEDGEPLPIPGSHRVAKSAMVIFGDEIEKLKHDEIIRRVDDASGGDSGVERAKRVIRDTLKPGLWADSESVRQKAGVSVSTFKRAKIALEDEGFVVASRPVRRSGGERIDHWEIGCEFIAPAAPQSSNTKKAQESLGNDASLLSLEL